MVRVGYLFHADPSTPPDPVLTERLHQAGSETVWVDWAERTAYQTVLARIAQGSITELVVLQLADLGDTLAEVHALIQKVQAQGMALLLLDDQKGLLNCQDPHIQLDQWLSEIPTTLHRRRMSQEHARRRLDGKLPPGPVPFGYRREENDLVVDRKAAAVVKDFFEHFLLYGSLRSAVRHVQQKHGKQISVATGKRWLANPVYRGHRVYNDGSRIPNTHVPLLLPQEAAQIDRWLRRNQSMAPRAASAARSLSGLVFCQTCQKPLRVVQVSQRARPERYLYMRCPTCRYSLPYAQILETVITTICQQLPQRINTFNTAPLEGIRAGLDDQIRQNEIIFHQISDLQQQGVLDALSAQRRRHQLTSENALLAEKMNQLPPKNLAEVAQTLSIEPFWQDLSESERRSYFREFIRRIQVNEGSEVQVDFFV